MKLVLVVRVLTDRTNSPDALLKVFQRVWAKKGGITLTAFDCISFLLYFEELDDLNFALQKATWNFNNVLWTAQGLDLDISTLQIQFNFLSF